MASLPPLEFTLDGPGLSLAQIGAVLKYQKELAARRAAGKQRAAGDDRHAAAQVEEAEELDRGL